MTPDPEDIATLRADGDLLAWVRSLTPQPATKPAVAEAEEPDQPSYHIPRRGAWPCGTAATGPTPKPCPNCQNTA